MWRLVCSRGVKVEYRDIRTEGSEVKGHWVFDYKFHGTNPVHNEMDSTFIFRDGKILVHHDHVKRPAGEPSVHHPGGDGEAVHRLFSSLSPSWKIWKNFSATAAFTLSKLAVINGRAAIFLVPNSKNLATLATEILPVLYGLPLIVFKMKASGPRRH